MKVPKSLPIKNLKKQTQMRFKLYIMGQTNSANMLTVDLGEHRVG